MSPSVGLPGSVMLVVSVFVGQGVFRVAGSHRAGVEALALGDAFPMGVESSRRRSLINWRQTR